MFNKQHSKQTELFKSFEEAISQIISANTKIKKQLDQLDEKIHQNTIKLEHTDEESHINTESLQTFKDRT